MKDTAYTYTLLPDQTVYFYYEMPKNDNSDQDTITYGQLNTNLFPKTALH